MRQPPRRRQRPSTIFLFWGVILLAAAALVVNLDWVRARLGDSRDGSRYVVTPLRIGSSATNGAEQQLYVRNDRWTRFLAPESACPGGEDELAPTDAQERTMICLLDYARMKEGLAPLRPAPLLFASSRSKALDIERCRVFEHAACGKDPRAVAEAVGYRSVSWGENLYLGPGGYGKPRVALDRWLNSPRHRENLFQSSWSEQGVALVTVREFLGQKDVALWVSEFGGG